jgi:chitinase
MDLAMNRYTFIALLGLCLELVLPQTSFARYRVRTTTSTSTINNSSGCTIKYLNWTSNVSYVTGAIVLYANNGRYYQALHDNPGYDPTISTYFWSPYTCPAAATTTAPVASTTTASTTTAATTTASTSTKVIAGYWTNWTPSAVRIRDINLYYNVIYLFSAVPVGGSPGTTGAVSWTPPDDGRGAATNFVSDIQYARKTQGRKIILSVGGAGNGMSFPYRAKSQAFVDSIVSLYKQFGGFDGLDWNTFEASQTPDTSEMIWISLQLKSLFPGFIITAPPAPWNPTDLAFCTAMVKAGALDYAAPQYYDGPGLSDPSYVATNIDQWVSQLGEAHVVLGLGIWNQANYMTISDARNAWSQVNTKHPNVQGVFNWQIANDENQQWGFANTFGALIH